MIPAHLIIQAVCEFHGVQLADLTGAGRAPQICWPRHELVYMLRGNAGLSLSEVGRLVGDRDAKTVQNSLNQVTRRIGEDLDYRAHVQRLNQFVLAFEDRPSGATAIDRARRVISAPAAPLEHAQGCAIALLAAASILSSPALTDGEARRAALQALGHSAI